MIPQPNALLARSEGRVRGLVGRSGRSDRNTLGAVPGNRLGHNAGGLHVLDEGTKEAGRSLAVFRGADRLLDGRELPVEDAGAREFLDVGEKPRLEPGERLELLADERLE